MSERVERCVELSARIEQVISFEDTRPRNPLGMFVDKTMAGADPNIMWKAYAGRRAINPDILKIVRRRRPRFEDADEI